MSCGDIETNFKKVEDAIQHLSSKIADIQDLTALQAKVAALDSRTQLALQRISALQSRMNSSESRISSLNGIIEGLRGWIQSLGSKVSQLNSTTNEVKQASISATASIASLFALAGLAKSEIKAAKSEAAYAKKLSGEALFKIGDATKAINEIKPFTRRIPALEKDVKGVYSRFAPLQDKISKASQNATQALKKSGSALSAAATNASGIKGLAGKLLGVLNIIGTLATIASLTAVVIENNKQWADIRALKAKDERIERRISDETHGRMKEDDNLGKRIDALKAFSQEKLFEVKRDLLSFIDKAVDKLDAKLNGKISEIYSSLQSVRAYLDNRINGLRDSVNRELEQIRRLIQNIRAEFRQEIQKLDERLGGRISKLEQLIQSIRQQINSEIRKLLTQLESRLAKVEKFVQSVRTDLLQRIEKVQQWLAGQFPTIAGMAAAIALAQLLARLPGLIAQNAPKMSCRFNDTAARDAASAAKRNEQKTTVLNTFVQGSLFKNVSDGFKGTFTRLGEPLAKGGIGAKLMRLGVVQAADRVMNFLVFFATIHNAMMLSKNVLLTLTETMTVGLDVIQTRLGLKDSEDEPLDVTKAVGESVNSFMASLLGAARWAELKQSFAAANRILQAGANIVYQVRSLTDSSLTIGQFIGENLAKLMNGLKFSGVVDKLSYPFVSETVNPQSIILQRIQNAGDAADALSSVTSEIKSIQEEAGELGEQTVKFQEMIEKGKKQASDLADAWDDNSLTPQIDPTKDF
jgi:predicted  nucleic acid-binding Zn-ribbon protein